MIRKRTHLLQSLEREAKTKVLMMWMYTSKSDHLGSNVLLNYKLQVSAFVISYIFGFIPSDGTVVALNDLN